MPEPVPRAPLGSPSAATLTAGRTGRAGALSDGRAGAGALPGPGASA
jgi:hypothetical protein